MNQIISALIDKNAIGNDNVVTASYTVRDGSGRMKRKIGEFGIVSINRSDDHIDFTVTHVIDKNQIKIHEDQIVAIDGMDINRYADVYDINHDGSKKKIGKKRGRKPKNHKY